MLPMMRRAALVASRSLPRHSLVSARCAAGSTSVDILKTLPGPAGTMDDIPVPFKPYKEEHAKLQSKFNMYLAASAAFLLAGVALAIQQDSFCIDAISTPQNPREYFIKEE